MDGHNENRLDDQISNSSDDDGTRIENGFFGITDKKNNVENITSLSDNNGLKMDTDDVTEIKQCYEKTDGKINETNYISLETSSCKKNNNSHVEVTEVSSFDSHILGSNAKDLDPLKCSFATISEDYEKSIKNSSNLIAENSKNCHQEPIFDNSTDISPKNNSQPLLMISTNYQDSSSESSSSDDESSNTNCICIDSDDENSIISFSSNPVLKQENVKTKGELDINDLPPIEDLKISVDEDKCQPVGCIKSFVDTLVIVETFLNQPALDIDSVLFVDRGKRALGKIFDVFGPVNKPYYAVRFNNSDHIKNFNILIKEPVFCAPETEYSNFVLVSQLLQMKGSDASWKHNNEPPPECLDYSDDEAEKLAKKKRKQKKNQKSNNPDKEDSPDLDQNITNQNHTNKTIQHPRSQNFNRAKHNYNPRPSIPNQNSTFNHPPNQNPQISNHNSYPPNQNPQIPNHNSHPPNQGFYPPNYNPSYSNYNPHSNFNLRPPNFCPQPSSYGYGQRPFLSYAQQLSSMEHSHSYHQQHNQLYYDQNVFAPRPNYPYQNPHAPSGYEHQHYPPPNNPNTTHYHQN